MDGLDDEWVGEWFGWMGWMDGLDGGWMGGWIDG